MDSVNK